MGENWYCDYSVERTCIVCVRVWLLAPTLFVNRVAMLLALILLFMLDGLHSVVCNRIVTTHIIRSECHYRAVIPNSKAVYGTASTWVWNVSA